MPLRILHVGKYFPPYRGGMEVFLADLIRAQRQQGLDAHALVHGTPEPDDPPWVERVPVQFHLVYAPMAFGFRRALGRAIRRIQPDVLHLHMPNNSALWALTLLAARKVPWVVHWHSDVVVSNIKWSVALAYMLYRPFEQALLERAQQIFATSPPYLETSRALSPWRDKCEVVPLGINWVNQPLPQAPREGTGWRPETKLRLLSIGRLTYYKGFETLINAVSSMPGVELLIAGEGELRETLEALISATTTPGAPPSTRLLGAVDDNQKHVLLDMCDVFCLASRERTEAFGIVLLEAMQHGKPCLVTDLPGSGMPWVVAQAHAGLHVPFEDIEAWRSAIARLQHNAKLRQDLGKAGPKALHQYFSIQPCERSVARHYRGLAPDAPPAISRQGPLVVITTHNNEAEITRLVCRARALLNAHVLVVDNRSTDATCHLAEENGAQVLRPLLAMTSWGGLQTGLRYALAQGHQTVITLDAHSHDEIEEIPSLMAARDQADAVVGFFDAPRNRIRHLAWQWFRHLTGLGVHEFVSGLRLYNYPALRIVASPAATLLDYQDLGALLLIRRAGLRIAEVAFPMHTAKTEQTKSQSWRDTLRYVAASSLLGLAYVRARSGELKE